MEQEKLLKVSEDMKIVSIMNQLLENTFPEIIKKELEKNNIQKEILYCIYTRSCNGYIREKYLKELLKLDFDYWAIPFIVKLSDEYIVEILEVIYDKLKIRNNDDIKRFCLENKNIINKSYSRMISYWNEFYRSKEPSFHKYIKKILKESLFFHN